MKQNDTTTNTHKNNVLAEYPDVLTPEDVMNFLSIGRNTVYSILKTGELSSVKVGKQYRIPKKYILEYLYPCYNGINIDG